MIKNAYRQFAADMQFFDEKMKKIKFTTFIILVVMGWLFMGELNILNIDSFQYRYFYSDFYTNNNSNTYSARAELLKDLIRESEHFDVDFFIVRTQWNETYQYKTLIIGTSGAINAVKADGVKEGINKSLFFEDQQIEFKLMEDPNFLYPVQTCYFIGEEKDLNQIRNFKASLVDKYGGGFPKEKASNNELILAIVSCWSIVFFITLAFSMYEVICKRKENMIKVIMGDNLLLIFAKEALFDLLGFVAIYVISQQALEQLSHVSFLAKYVTLGFIAFLVINTFIDAFILKINYKRDLSRAKNGTVLLTVDYSIKIILTILVMITISLNYYIAAEAVNVLSLKEFFEDHNDYRFYKFGFHISEDDLDNDVSVEEEVYMNMYEKFQQRSLMYGDNSGDNGINTPFVEVNANALNELANEYPEIKDHISKGVLGNVSILVPDDLNEYDSQKLIEIYRDYPAIRDGSGKMRIIRYYDNIRVPAIHVGFNGYQIHNYTNPIILVNNYMFSNEQGLREYYNHSHNYCIMYNVEKMEWNKFQNENNISNELLSITNVNEEYSHHWNQQKRKLVLITAISAFIMYMELSMSFAIIYMEYSINAIERALKKVHGYSLIERNKRLILSSLASVFIGLLLTFVINIVVSLKISIKVLVVIGAVLFVLEAACILVKAFLMELKSISQILKGETI